MQTYFHATTNVVSIVCNYVFLLLLFFVHPKQPPSTLLFVKMKVKIDWWKMKKGKIATTTNNNVSSNKRTTSMLWRQMIVHCAFETKKKIRKATKASSCDARNCKRWQWKLNEKQGRKQAKSRLHRSQYFQV